MSRQIVEVGDAFKRRVTAEDAEIYLVLKAVIEASAETKDTGCWHYGLEDIGNLATYLDRNYILIKRGVAR